MVFPGLEICKLNFKSFTLPNLGVMNQFKGSYYNIKKNNAFTHIYSDKMKYFANNSNF